MPLTVYFPRALKPAERAALLEAAREPIEIVDGPELPGPASYDVLVNGEPTREQLAASPRLRAVVIPWAGVTDEASARLREFPALSLHNLHHNAETTAEVALALLLAAAKRVVPLDQGLRQGDWSARYESSRAVRLYGKCALILGFGHIGQHVGRVCQAMGMSILATRRDPEQPLPEGLNAQLYGPDALRELLPRANVLIVTLPLTDDTRGLIGEAELALLPPSSILVNVGRGPIVQEQPLYEALASGRLHSAGLDVWYRYPESKEERSSTSPSSYPFHELDNVVMSPHRGGAAMDMMPERMAALARLLDAAARGEEMPNRIDLEAGY